MFSSCKSCESCQKIICGENGRFSVSTRQAKTAVGVYAAPMNHKIRLPILLFALLTACAHTSAPGDAVPSSEAATPDAAATLVLPTAVAAPPQPTLIVPDSPVPAFYNLRFATSADAAPQPYFSQGTEQVFAVWDYANIPIGATVRRVWLLNGEPWLEREEAWTGAASGTVQDVSIYDFTGGGLQPGKYEVLLYLGDALLVNGRFWVNTASAPYSVPSPNGTTIAQRLGDRSLVLAEAPDLLTELTVTDHPISEIAWLPSGKKLLVVTEDSTERIANSTIGIRHALWLVDTLTSQISPLGFYDEDLHEVGVSENGRFLSFISGTSYGDACMVDRTLVIMALDEQGNRLSLLQAGRFTGLPQAETGSMGQFYPADNGRWVGNNQFEISVAVTCQPEGANATLPGLYRLNTTTLQAERIGDLPPAP